MNAFFLTQKLGPSFYVKRKGARNYLYCLDPILCKVASLSESRKGFGETVRPAKEEGPAFAGPGESYCRVELGVRPRSDSTHHFGTFNNRPAFVPSQTAKQRESTSCVK